MPRRPDKFESSVGFTFRSGYQLLWRNTKNARNCYRMTEELIDFVGENSPVSIWSDAKVLELMENLRAKGNSVATINRKLACLSKLMKYAKRREAVAAVPEITYYKEGKGRIRWLTDNEESKLRELMPAPHKFLTDFLLYTGCRMGEALSLTHGDLSEERVTYWETKGGRPRTLPVHPRAYQAAQGSQAFYADPRLVFPMKYDDYHRHWCAAKLAMGLKDDPDFVPHALRHTCATRLVRKGVDIRRVKEWLGHSTITMTMRYAHLAPADLNVCLSALGDPVN